MKSNSMLNRILSVLVIWTLLFALFVGLIQFADEAEGATIIVPVDYPTIQGAINAANPGDTIQVWDGIYVENIVVNETVSLVGNSSATTIIDGNLLGNAALITSDWVNMTGFSFINGMGGGINVGTCSQVTIDNSNISSNNGPGIYFYDVFNGTIKNSDIIFNSGGGIFLQDWGTDYTSIEDCNIYSNNGVGISLGMGASNTQIIGTNISGHAGGYGIFSDNTNDLFIKDTKIWQNDIGIYLDISYDVIIEGSDIYSNNQFGIYMWGSNNIIKDCNIISNVNEGIRLLWSSNLDMENTTIANHATGINAQGVKNAKITNSSIVNCTTDIYLQNDSDFDLLNTTFNKTRVLYNDLLSSIIVRWFLHVYVNDSIGNPISGAQVTVRNVTGIGIFEGLTNPAGYINWIIVAEYFENQSIKRFHTDHNITSHDGTQFGWAQPDANMTQSKVIVVTLASPMPATDYIEIQDAIGGNVIGNTMYRIEDVIPMYAIAYNNTMGFIGPVPATWSSSDPGVGDVDIGPSSKTLFTAFIEGTCFVSAVNISALDITGVLNIIWLVENLDQATVHPTIQKAINRSNPGDRLLAKPWTYYENVRVNKTVTLMGTDKSTTIINGQGLSDALQVEADWVNISGFSMVRGGSGIGIYNNALNTKIEDCLTYSNIGFGIYVGGAENTIINNTEVYSNVASGSGYGIGMDSSRSTDISFSNITGNANAGIYMWGTAQTIIRNNNIWNNLYGVTLEFSNDIEIRNCEIFLNTQRGLTTSIWGTDYRIKNSNITSNGQEGIYVSGAVNYEISNTNIVNHTYGIWAQSNSDCEIINSSIVNSNPQTDIYLTSNSKVTTLNTSFNKSSANITDSASELIVNWYMHVLVEDFVGQPISGAEVFVQDLFGAVVKNGFADVDGSVRWIVVTEYIENQTLKTYYTPHIVTATVATDIVSDNITMDISKFLLLQLSSLQPSVVLELVAGLQYSNINAEYDVLVSVTQGNKPRKHTVDTVISITIYDDDMNKIVDSDPVSLLDSDLGLYSYSNITTGVGVYFVVASFTASGVIGTGLTSFEVVDWIEDISNANDSLGQISDVLDDLNQTSDTINSTLDSLNNQLANVNDSLMNQLTAMETNLLNKLVSLNETNILSYLQGMNASLFTEIQSLLVSITDDVIGMNASLSDELTALLNSLTTDNNALRSWLDIVLTEVDSNINGTEIVLANKIDDLNTNMTTFNNNVVSDLASILSSIQLHDNITDDNHTAIVGKLDDLLSGGVGEVDLSDLEGMLTDLAYNLSSSNESIANDLFGIASDISTFETKVSQDLDDIDSALQDLDNIQDVITKLNNLNSNLTTGNDQLEDKIDQIPKEKAEEEEGFGLTQILLILVLVLVLVNLLIMLMGRKKGGGEEVIPHQREDSQERSSISDEIQEKPEDENLEVKEDESEFEIFEDEEEPVEEDDD
jgi:parallel beta-helix repeat protein